MTGTTSIYRLGRSASTPLRSRLRVADHWSRVVREDAGHRLQVADVAIGNAEEREDGGLVGGDAVEVRHGGLGGSPAVNHFLTNCVCPQPLGASIVLLQRCPTAMSYLDRVKPVVDQTISTLASARFAIDPIAGAKYSRLTSVVSSAYKRHGTILELALRESLRESNRHRVWREEAFRVSRAADQLIGQQEAAAYDATLLPYGEGARTLQIDMMVFDSADQTLRAYEIKRGFGQFDAGKIRSIKRDLMVTQMLLKSYGQTFNVSAERAEARIIFYYGRRSIPRPYSLIVTDLNDHFGFPVYDLVEQANAYFQQQLYALLDRI